MKNNLKLKTDIAKVRAFNKMVREKLNDVGITKVSYYCDYTHPNVTTKQRKIFKFGQGGMRWGHGSLQKLNLESATPVLDHLNTVDDGGWLPWFVYNDAGEIHTIDGVKQISGIYKHTE